MRTLPTLRVLYIIIYLWGTFFTFLNSLFYTHIQRKVMWSPEIFCFFFLFQTKTARLMTSLLMTLNRISTTQLLLSISTSLPLFAYNTIFPLSVGTTKSTNFELPVQSTDQATVFSMDSMAFDKSQTKKEREKMALILAKRKKNQITDRRTKQTRRKNRKKTQLVLLFLIFK